MIANLNGEFALQMVPIDKIRMHILVACEPGIGVVLIGVDVEANVVVVPEVIVVEISSVPSPVVFVSIGTGISAFETSFSIGNAGISSVDKLGVMVFVMMLFMVMGVCVL